MSSPQVSPVKALLALCFCGCGLLFSWPVGAAGQTPPMAGLDSFFNSGETDLLTAEEAFDLVVESSKAGEIRLLIQSPPGYFLYRDRFGFTLDSPAYHLGKPVFSGTETMHDGLTGEAEVLTDGDSILLPFRVDAPTTSRQMASPTLTVRLQGCAKDRFCYPPVSRQLVVPVLSQ